MRTLKKSLALVLALVMVLGLGVVGASADNKLDDYTDAKDIGDAYVEAVGVMTGLEIVDGMTETTIDPTATYTREQAAKIIAYMVLGKTAADSLTCTVAPFDDVAADRWSAGYISFCVEQGIIDGMTDTTFEPTGTLTGFQWAKMLLSAVGFNAKGEFTGDSWSLNTSRVAHSVGLFTGDAAGADHVALQRQQAMLYAFNTLTVVKQVVWSEALGDYIYKYGEFADRYTGEGTLGETVFDLHKTEGIINDNEATGGPDTRVFVGGTTQYTYVEADTGLDMMYHAARIWYVGDAKQNGDAVSVYVVDLAETTTYTCDAIADGAKKTNYTEKTVGETMNDPATKAYELAVVNNPDGYTDYEVTYQYAISKLGPRSETKNLVAIDGISSTISMDDVMTDISAIHNNDNIIVLYAESARKSSDIAVHVFPFTATAGNVQSYNNKTGVITLTDGTEIAPSVFFNDVAYDGEIANLIATLKGSNSRPAYSFALDTHGHYISLSTDAFEALAYFTGTYHKTSAHDAWYGEAEYVAQFARVSNGEIVEVPVTAQWIRDYGRNSVVINRGYFDITDELFDQEVYYPEEKTVDDNVYGEQYAVVGNGVTVDAKSHTMTVNIEGKNETVYYDYDDVVFYVATGFGSTFDVSDYTGNSGLLNYYSEKFGRNIDEITLNNVAVYMSETSGNNKTVLSVFVYDDIASAKGGVVFFPKDVDGNWVVTDSYFIVNGAYVDGKEVDNLYVASETDTHIDAGFYEYTINADNLYELKAVDAGEYYYLSESDSMKIAGNPLSKAWLEVNGKEVAEIDIENVTVLDLRADKTWANIDTMTELADLLEGDFNGYLDGQYIDIAAVVVDGMIEYIYVVDANYYTVNFAVNGTGLPEGMAVVKGNETTTVPVWADQPRTVYAVMSTTRDGGLEMSGVTAANFTISNGTTSTTYTYNVGSEGWKLSNGNSVITIPVEVNGACTVTFTGFVTA